MAHGFVVLFYIRISKSGKVSKIDADGLLDIGYLTRCWL
jgi:hypothetical protein